MIQPKNTRAGLSILGAVILIGALIFILSFFDIRLKEVVESPAAQDNIEYVEEGAKSVWERYLSEPASYLWNDVWVDIFWKSFIYNMKRIRDGLPTDVDKAGESLQTTSDLE